MTKRFRWRGSGKSQRVTLMDHIASFGSVDLCLCVRVCMCVCVCVCACVYACLP
jgi:hypothetical protein